MRLGRRAAAGTARDADVRPVGQPAGGERSQHRHIAEASARLFEVGLEQIGSVTEGSEALVE